MLLLYFYVIDGIIEFDVYMDVSSLTDDLNADACYDHSTL